MALFLSVEMRSNSKVIGWKCVDNFFLHLNVVEHVYVSMQLFVSYLSNNLCMFSITSTFYISLCIFSVSFCIILNYIDTQL